ncbi:AAA family ATPase [Candidatus Kaiserbacteria bacterium]|nr:AAA family ATPase [Candidatus Kaiserbacteria bacterium]
MIIGITGTDGAGKGVVVDYLVEKHDFVHYPARQLWVDEINRRGLEVKRENMRIVANDLRRQHGNDYLITAYIARVKEGGVGNAIIESIRTIAEAETLKTNGGILLAVDADQHLRYERIVGRASESDRVTFEQFAAQEALEMNDPDPNGMQKAAVMAMADHTILNNGTLDELHTQIEKMLSTLEA